MSETTRTAVDLILTQSTENHPNDDDTDIPRPPGLLSLVYTVRGPELFTKSLTRRSWSDPRQSSLQTRRMRNSQSKHIVKLRPQ